MIFSKEIEYNGFIIDKIKTHINLNKIKAITKDSKQLQSFLVGINYYSKFTPYGRNCKLIVAMEMDQSRTISICEFKANFIVSTSFNNACSLNKNELNYSQVDKGITITFGLEKFSQYFIKISKHIKTKYFIKT